VSYLSEVIADAPIHYWRFADPGGGLCFDLGSTPKHMHAVGTPILGYSGPNSNGGSLDLSLDGTFAHTGELIAFPGGRITLELLYWPWRQIGTARQLVYWQGTPLQLALYNDGANWSFIYGNTLCTAAGGVGHTQQAWVHLVGTYDLTNERLYVNGALQTTVAVATMAGSSGLLSTYNPASVIGGLGFYSELAVYSTTLSAARVTAHYNAIDQVAQQPVFNQAGSFIGASGAGSPLATLASDVRAAVYRTFTD
jgi:concanavalin A-like lectin/glucanase superfamily protein